MKKYLLLILSLGFSISILAVSAIAGTEVVCGAGHKSNPPYGPNVNEINSRISELEKQGSIVKVSAPTMTNSSTCVTISYSPSGDQAASIATPPAATAPPIDDSALPQALEKTAN